MGQQASQLERGDLDGVEDDRSILDSQQGVRPDYDSDQGSPQPFEKHDASSQDFAFSSQVPYPATQTRHAYKTNGKTLASEFDRSSASPEPAIVKSDQEVAPVPKPAKRKRARSSKRKSLTGTADDQDQEVAESDNMAAETKSSIDLDGVSSSPLVGQAVFTTDGNVNGDTIHDETAEMDLEELRRREKRERKERRKARKAAKQAEELRSSLLAANPNFGAHTDPAALEQARTVQLQGDDVEEKDAETTALHRGGRMSSQKSGDPPRNDTNSQAEYAAVEDVDDTRMEDPNQLPTPDDDIQPIVPTNNITLSQDGVADAAQGSLTVAPASSRKRKAKDSDKKSRKKRKEPSRLSQEDVVDSEEANNDEQENAPIGSVEPPGSALPGSTSHIGELAREFYSQRYASRNSTPSKSTAAAVSNKRLKLLGLSPVASDDSPSAARLQRQAGSARSSSERHLVKQEQPEDEVDEAVESMDIDSTDEQRGLEDAAADSADSAADASMADYNDDHIEPPGGENVPDPGSDDLGVAPSTGQVNDQEVSESEEEAPTPATRQVPESPTQPSTTTQSKALRQYGSKASTSKKRQVKASYLDRAEEGNAQAFAELPSPAVVAASKKGKARTKRVPTPAVAGPSGAPQEVHKQSKITSLMTGGAAGEQSSASERTSNITAPAPTFTRTLPKKVTRMKNPKPEEETVGPFTGNEMRNLTEAIETWRKDHKLSDSEMKEMVQKNPQMAKTSEFWDYVHYACPKRKRQKVINQVRKTYHNFVARATWTKEQHEELAALYEIHGKNYKLLGQLINRHSDDVRDRIRNYVVCGDSRKVDVWTHEEEARLVTIINEAFDKIRELKGEERPDLQERDDEELVDWSVVSENMGWTRSRLQCRAKWKQIRLKMEGGNIDGKAGHSMEEIVREAREDFKKMTQKDLYLIAKAIKKSGTNADSRIGWHKLRAKWYAMEKWNRPALMLAWHRLRRAVPDWRVMSVPEIAKHQMEYYEQHKEVHLLPEEQMDLDAEYREMEHKVTKIIKGINNPKTPHFAIKSSDEDGIGQQALGDIENDEEDELDIEEEEPATSKPVESEAPSDIEDEALEPQSQTQTKSRSKARRSTGKALPTIEQSPETQAQEIRHDASETSHVPKSARGGRSAAKSRSQAYNKRSLGKQPLSAEKIVDEDEVSSDTDADDVEDIPAILPD